MAVSFTEKTIAQAQFTGTPGTAALLYTVPTATIGLIKTITVCNTGAATTFRLYSSNSGAAAAIGNAIYYDVAIGANETLELTAFRALAATGTIRYDAGVATQVTFTVYGAEVLV